MGTNRTADKPLVIKRLDGRDWERIVYAEVLIPETPNVYGDYWTKDGIREAAYMFQQSGYGIDLEHDNVDITGEVYVAESFIARAGDPDFIEGSWVLAMKVENDDLWQAILRNEINGFSYQAEVAMLGGVYNDATDTGVRTGFTEPDVNDGHVHTYAVLVDEDNRPVMGETDEVNGHAHMIYASTVTEEAGGHTHRYNLVNRKDS